MGHNNIIEINGKQYDAVTGTLLGESRVKATPESRARHTPHQGRVIDGFIRHHQAPMPVATPVVRTEAPATPAPSPVKVSAKKFADIQRPKASQAKAHQPQRSQTLMRHVVKKPNITKKTAIKTTGPAEMIAKPESSLTTQLAKKVSVTQVNPVRLARATHVSRSQHIRRYAPSRDEQRHTVAVNAVRPGQHNAAVRSDVRVAARPTKSRSIALEQAAQSLAGRKKANDLFEEALIHASAHEQPLHKQQGKKAHRHRRLASAIAGVGAFLVIGGFIAYINMPNIELRVASIHAGFHAELPGYKPTGYALDGGVKASKGQVQLTYRSGDSSYTITQVASDWNSATLLDQNTEQRGAPTQTVQSEGRIIYIYNNQASWVDSGVHYEISGNASLDSDDLVSLATSM